MLTRLNERKLQNIGITYCIITYSNISESCKILKPKLGPRNNI